jgi:hypothetical protein
VNPPAVRWTRKAAARRQHRPEDVEAEAGAGVAEDAAEVAEGAEQTTGASRM